MHYIFIVNPTSGKGKALKISKKIVEVCNELKLNYDIHYTSYPKEATEIALKYKNENNIIFSVGGDGTLLEVLNGVVGTKNLLGIVPAGSGNDFYRVLEDTSEEYIKTDIGKVNDTYFLNVTSFGIDAETAKNVLLMKKLKVPSSLVYIFSLIYTFLKYKQNYFEFKTDKIKEEGKFTILTICNGNFYGGGFHIAPYASVKDGYFDIYYVKKISKLKILKLVGKLKAGTHENSIHVNKIIDNKISIESDTELICNIDGEIIRDKKFEIKLIKDGINLYNNKSLVNKFLN